MSNKSGRPRGKKNDSAFTAQLPRVMLHKSDLDAYQAAAQLAETPFAAWCRAGLRAKLEQEGKAK